MNKAIFKLAKLAIPLLMSLAFVLPSLTLWLSHGSTHSWVVEVCTERGLEKVVFKPEGSAQWADGSSSLPQKRLYSKDTHPSPQSHQSLDHCPLCQLPALSGEAGSSLPLARFDPQLARPTHRESQVPSTLWAWANLPARAPPTSL
jgi:hypothetical protein